MCSIGWPFLGEGLFQAAGEERGDVVEDGGWHVEGLVAGGHGEGIDQGQLGQGGLGAVDGERAEGGVAQRERVAAAGGQAEGGGQSGEVVEPVCQRSDQVSEVGGNSGDAIGPVVHAAEPVGEGQAGQPVT